MFEMSPLLRALQYADVHYGLSGIREVSVLLAAAELTTRTTAPTISYIAEVLEMKPQVVSRWVRRLAYNGHLTFERVSGDEDNRLVLIQPTEAGQEIATQLTKLAAFHEN